MMKIKSSKLIKSTLSVLLALMMLLSCGVTSIIGATVDLAPESANVDIAEVGASGTVYFNPGVWNVDGAWYQAWTWGGSGSTWMDLTDADGDGIYEGTVPNGNTTMIILRKSPSHSAGNWDCWNRIDDITIYTNNKIYKVNGWSYGSWSDYTPPASKVTATFKNEDGSTFATLEVNSGSAPGNPTGTPTKEGYTFTGWSPDPSLAITADTTYTPQFEINKYTVTFSYLNASGATTTSVVNNVEHGSTVSAPSLPTVPGKTFTSWDKPLTNITSTQTITAQYDAIDYDVTVTVNPSAGGTVTGAPSTANYGDTLELTATPASENYVFTSWEVTGGSYTTNGNKVSITVQGNVNVTANFTYINTYTFTAQSANETMGTVSPNTTQTVAENTDVTITATANEGYVFTGWTFSDDTSSTDASTTVTVTKNLTATANFRGAQGTVTLQGFDTAGGSVEGTSDSVTYPNAVPFTATANDGYTFTGWQISSSGDADSYKINGALTDSSISVQILKDGTTVYVTPKFSQGQYLTIYARSDSSRTNLYLWEKNSSSTKELNGAWASAGALTETVDINGVTWYKSQVFTLTEGYSTQVGAILKNDSGKSSDIILTDILYTDGTWNGVSEVWIYDASGDNDIATKRSEIISAVNTYAATYTAGENGWTSETWSAFKSAYETAKTTSGAYASTQTEIDNALSALITAYSELAAKVIYQMTLTQNVSGTVKVDSVAVAGDTFQLTEGKDSTIRIEAPTGYYISSVLFNGVEKASGSDTQFDLEFTASGVTSNGTLIVTYTARQVYTITIDSALAQNGTLTYNGNALTAGEAINVYAGDTVTVTAAANTGYTVGAWVVDGVSGASGTTYTFSNISSNHTLGITWKEIAQYSVTVDASPYSGGTATGTTSGSVTITSKRDGNNSANVLETETITFTATPNSLYKFTGWSISGKYSISSGGTGETTITIVPQGDITAVAQFEKAYKAIYLDNDANWSQPYIYYWNSSTPSVSWPGEAMTFVDGGNSKNNRWVAYIPIDANNISFNVGNDSAKIEYDLTTSDNKGKNTFTNGSSSGYPATTPVEGYYLQGTWNGSKHDAYDLVMFDENRDGTYSLTIDVTSVDANGYITVNPTDKDSNFWQPTGGDTTDNPATLVKGTYTATPNVVKVALDMAANPAGYRVTFTFNPDTGEFSWTATKIVPSVTVIGDDGALQKDGSYLGDTYFNESNIIDSSNSSHYQTATVEKNAYVTFYTQVYASSNPVAGDYDYRVEGWVINGTDFVYATSLGNGLYSGQYRFTADSTTVVPVYFHTDKWLEYYNTDTVTLYTIKPDGIDKWDDYLAAYTWFAGEADYGQFGKYPGQLLIPVKGLDGVYYTVVELQDTDDVTVKGITFSNYNKTDPVNTESTYLQSYDFYEFVSYAQNGYADSITFVLKNHNNNYNREDINSDGTVKNDLVTGYNYITYTNYNNEATDIFGDVITDANLNTSKTVYVIRSGNADYLNVYNNNEQYKDENLNGKWYVQASVYTKASDGTVEFLGWVPSYKLHDGSLNDLFTEKGLAGCEVMISYETGASVADGNTNSSGSIRYDGEWYVSDNTATVIISVNVAEMVDGNLVYKLDSEGNKTNIADYGEAYVGNNQQSVEINRNDTFTAEAFTLAGYRFIGWYTENGTFIDKTIALKDMQVAINASYTAVFEKLVSGNFYVEHYIYAGNGTASKEEIPEAHGGNASLYIGIENTTTGESVSFAMQTSASVAAQEGDELLITIGTDPAGINKFFAWYVNAVGATGTTFEEVGVDSDDNLAFSDPSNPYYNNGTVIGRSDMVYFQFKYTVGKNLKMTIYSDCVYFGQEVTLVYNYNDRDNSVKSYYYKYELSDLEIEGFEGNGYSQYTPAYINTDIHQNTVLKYAPFVGDYYKDATWVITESRFDTLTFNLWATQDIKYYTVTTNIDGAVGVSKVPYNTLLDLDATQYGFAKGGFWYKDINQNGAYDVNVDIILANGVYYGYRVTEDMTINYEPSELKDFTVSLDSPVYGREQSTDSNGANVVDKVLVDYVIDLVPPFVYSGGNFDVWYNGKEITDQNWAGQIVTIESLEKAGYVVEFGILTEQVGSFGVNDGSKNSSATFAEALEKAQAAGYGTATDNATLADIVANYNGAVLSGGKYYTMFDATDFNITNKNRVLFTFEYKNTAANLRRFSNVYAYWTVTTPADANGETTTTTYFSNVQTLNIYETAIAGTI
ncbi:MAG: InlB B-repeat-containing protein [Ruminococcus sp.]